MSRFVIPLVILSTLVILSACSFSQPTAGDDFPRPEPDYNAKSARDFSAFEQVLTAFTPERAAELDALLTSKTMLEIQDLLDNGQTTSEELITYYIDRIQRYDVDKLNSVMALNPDALNIARSLDAERVEQGARGQMHGIPVLLKDNIATGDGMTATAGAYAMKDWAPDRDAFLVTALRDNGAIILGKANLSEWANYMDPSMPSGFSVLGGQTRNPYGAFEVWGSSSGSAVAAAANFAAVTVGTETQGSIVMPAGINSVVGLKTSRGLVSGDYIIPLMDWQDTLGPLGRTVTDVAVLLTAMTAPDPTNPETSDLAQADFTQFLTDDAMKGLRVGLVVEDEALTQAFAVAGIEVFQVDPKDIPGPIDVRPALEYGFQDSLNRFLATVDAPVKTLADVVAVNKDDLNNRAPYGQGYVEGSVNTEITQDEYEQMKAENSQGSIDAITAVFEQYGIDVLMSDVRQRYAPAGFPVITAPAGYDENGQPLPVFFTALHLEEGKLLSVAYAFEQATKAWVEPDLEKTIQQIEAIQNKN